MHGKRVVWRAYAKPYPTAVAPKKSEGADKSIDLTGGNSDGRKKRTKCNLSFKTFAAFTLAEILLSLTVIGIVAAIALPSLLGNANERAWETQKKALYTRFSQSLPLLPSLNGYGQLEEVKNGDDTEILDTASKTFIRDGLAKVMKITNICDSEHLTDCGLPDKIVPINNGSAITLSSISTMSGLNTRLIQGTSVTGAKFETLNTKTSAFETVNGESILVYYNPNCEPDLGELMYGANTVDTAYRHFSQPKMCANFIYDLNGKKGPNTVGKDIGTITVLYSTDPVIISPNPYPNDTTDSESASDITEKCKEKEDERVATIDELTAMFVNYKLYNYKLADHVYRSITKYPNSTHSYWVLVGHNGMRLNSNMQSKVRCVKR